MSEEIKLVPMYDIRGTKLEVGQKVAYNLSGQVVPGVIKSLAWGMRYKKPWPLIKVICSVDLPYGDTNHVSIVRDSRNLLVLLDGEH